MLSDHKERGAHGPKPSIMEGNSSANAPVNVGFARSFHWMPSGNSITVMRSQKNIQPSLYLRIPGPFRSQTFLHRAAGTFGSFLVLLLLGAVIPRISYAASARKASSSSYP